MIMRSFLFPLFCLRDLALSCLLLHPFAPDAAFLLLHLYDLCATTLLHPIAPSAALLLLHPFTLGATFLTFHLLAPSTVFISLCCFIRSPLVPPSCRFIHMPLMPPCCSICLPLVLVPLLAASSVHAASIAPDTTVPSSAFLAPPLFF